MMRVESLGKDDGEDEVDNQVKAGDDEKKDKSDQCR